MKVMTMQKAFNKVAAHLLKQNRKSKQDGTCLYRGEASTTCAFGCLIPDELYTPEFETKSVAVFFGIAPSCGIWTEDAKQKAAAMRNLLPEYSMFLFKDLQAVHDNSLPKTWPSKLRDVAHDHGLKLPKCLR